MNYYTKLLFSTLALQMLVLASCGEDTIKDTALRLKKHLFEKYSVLIRPKRVQNESIDVYFDIALKQVIDVDVKSQKMTLYLWQRQTWYDEFLTWDPAEFGGLAQVFVEPMDIWVPDIIFQNSLDDKEEVNSITVIKVMLLSSGQVVFFRPTLKSTTCQMSVKYFPYDSQVCAFQVGSWMLPEKQMDIKLLFFETSLSGFVKHHEWALTQRYAVRKDSVVVLNLSEALSNVMNFPFLEFSFLFERKPEFFEKNLIVPTALISALSEMTFLLPAQSGEKVGFAVTVFLSLCVNLLVIASYVPTSSESFPIIGQYYITCIFLIAISILQTTFILSIHFAGETFFVKPVPRSIRRLFFVFIGPMVGFRIDRTVSKCKSKSSNCFGRARRKSATPEELAFTMMNPSSSELPRRRFGPNRQNLSTPSTPGASCEPQLPESTREDLSEIITFLQNIGKLMQGFTKVNESRIKRYKMMEDWKYLSRIIDRISAIVYGAVTLYYSLYFYLESQSRLEYSLVPEDIETVSTNTTGALLNVTDYF